MAKKLSPIEQSASKKVLDALQQETKGMMHGKMDGLKKVSVASTSPEGLKKGLDLAKKIAGKEEAGEPADLLDEGAEDAEELSESPEMEASEQAHGSEVEGLTAEEEAMSPDEIDHLISKLEALKAKKQ